MLDLEFDHIGILVKSIDKEKKIYETLGYQVESEIFIDDNQKMRGLFMCSKNAPRVELIEDLSDSRALNKILNSQCGKIYHVAYKVKKLEEQIEDVLLKLNAKILSPIKEASYYDKVCFVFLPNAQIIELVEYR